MKFKIIISLFLFLKIIPGFSQVKNLVWTGDLEKQHFKNRQDSATWDKNLLQRDIDDSLTNPKGKPFPHGAFPVPKYDLAGDFRYRGEIASGRVINYLDKTIVCSFFAKGKTIATEPILKQKENEVFFIFMMLTDFVDTVKYTNGSSFLLSRNNPDVTCEGFYKTKTDEIDYMAFITANRDEFAVVNMRLFNLKLGRVILIAPQKDHSLRSLQIEIPIISNTEVSDYIDKILKQDNVKSFLASERNI